MINQIQQERREFMSKQNPLKEIDASTYKQVPYRYVNFVLYILAALANSLPAQTFASINTLVSDRYNYDQVVVTLFTLFFPILHPIGAFPANWILDKFGMKIGCTVGGILLVIGVWMRTLLEIDNPFWCLIGSLFAAIGNIFILNSPSILANSWFKPASIPGVISLAVLANLISVTLGNAIPGLVLDIHQSSSQDIQRFLRIQAIVISIIIGVMILGLKNRPEVPPSRSAENKQNIEHKYKQLLSKLFKNKQYLKIMLVMTFSYGTLISYLANLDPVLKEIGYTNPGKATVQIIIAAMVSGILASFFFISRIKKTLQYKAILTLCLGLNFVFFSILQVVFLRKASEAWILYIFGTCVGFFSIPITSMLMAYSSEVVYPLGEGSATGYLFAASQTFGFALGIGSATLVESRQQGQSLWTIYLFMGMHILFTLLAFLSVLLTKNLLNRTKYETGKAKQQQRQTEEGFIFSST